MTEKIPLSLCVITKNDEALLPGFLNDTKEIADEILVADLGSRDWTCELARQAGGAVYQPKWEDDFSKIKNFCMEHAAGKWVLFLQADEVLSQDQWDELKLLLKNPNAEGYLVYVEYRSEERAVSSPTQFLRLLRNRKDYRFRRRSFEFIPDETLYAVQGSRLHITHRGEKTVGWQMKERVRLLKEDVKENPRDSYVRYLEGIESLNRENYEESAASFELARQTVNWGYLYAPHLYKCLGVSLLSLNRNKEAEDVLKEGIRAFPSYSDLLVLRAVLYRRLDLVEKAREDLENCRNLQNGLNVSVPGPEIAPALVEEMLKEVRAEN